MEGKGDMITAITCCDSCPRQGCGKYHDDCPPYQAQKNQRKADLTEVKKKQDFNRFLKESVERCAKKRKGNFISAMSK